MRKEYSGFTLPKPLVSLVDKVVSYEIFGFSSRSEFVREAIRKQLDEKIQEIAVLEEIEK